MWKFALASNLILLLLMGCAEIEPKPFTPSSGHIASDPEVEVNRDIPDLVTPKPVLPAPVDQDDSYERYTIVVYDLPVQELLFALARDSGINIDIDTDISGRVTINAVEQSLPQILERIARQVDIRYQMNANNLYIESDEPFLKIYTIDYVNVSRDTSSTSSVSTQIASASGSADASGGGGGNNSVTGVSTESSHHFWDRLIANITAILGEEVSSPLEKMPDTPAPDMTESLVKKLRPLNGPQHSESEGGEASEIEAVTPPGPEPGIVTQYRNKRSQQGLATVIANPESGILTIRATAAQHKQVKSFIDAVLSSAKRQVLIQTTIVEVTLNKDYQAGIDWSFLGRDGHAGFNIISETLEGTSIQGSSSSFVISSEREINSNNDNLIATVRFLDEFGDARILSSPQMMVLNNQTALLKVVDNIVYFEIDSEVTPGQQGSNPLRSTDTTAKTLPVGIIMAVTPQIGANGIVTLNVRPTISRLLDFVNDPNPMLAEQSPPIENPVPRIAVREMESVLRLANEQIGILGGLMTDETKDSDVGLPGIKDHGLLGNLFKSKSAQYTKTELVIFLRPTIITEPDINNDLSSYKQYLDIYGGSLKQPVSLENN